VKQRLALYQGVVPILMDFSDDAEETFSRAITSLLVSQLVFYHYFDNMPISHEK
jgi:pyruvate kinase